MPVLPCIAVATYIRSEPLVWNVDIALRDEDFRAVRRSRNLDPGIDTPIQLESEEFTDFLDEDTHRKIRKKVTAADAPFHQYRVWLCTTDQIRDYASRI